MHSNVVVIIAAVLAGGVLAHWLGWRLRMPAIVFLLAGGIVAGPITGAVDPDAVFGDVLFPGVSIAVAVILFEGALGLGWRGVRQAGRAVWMLLTVGAAITLGGTWLAARLILDVDWRLALIIGSVLVVTGPTVIGPLVRAIGLHGRLASVLEAEGTLIDPVGAILTVLVFQAVYDEPGSTPVATQILQTAGFGILIGAVGALLIVVTFSRHLVPDQLQNVTTLAVVVSAFAAADELHEEAGLVAVIAMGFILASQRRAAVRHILEFNETLRILFISGLFILLGARIEAETLRQVEWRNIAFLATLVVLVRPVSVLVSTFGSALGKRERLFLAATAPRGIVAASIASIFSLQLAERGVDNSQVLVSATFTVIAGTVLLSGLGARHLARVLKLGADDRTLIVVLGANAVARAFAEALDRAGAPVRLVDLDRKELARARMTGLWARQGTVYADDTWDAIGIQSAACFVAMTSNDDLNTLAARHASALIGRRNVYQLQPRKHEHAAWWTFSPGTFARPLFGRETTWDVLADRLERGAKVTATTLTEKFGARDYALEHPNAIVLFRSRQGRIDIHSADATLPLRATDTVVAVTGPTDDEVAERAALAAVEVDG